MSRMKFCVLSILIINSAGVDAQPSSSDPRTGRDFYERGLKREEAENYDGAKEDYRKAGELDPKLFDAHFSLSSLCAEAKDYPAAIEALTAALHARPRDYSALFNRGLYHQYLRQYDDAIESYSRALDKGADFSHSVASSVECRARAYHYRGRVYQWYRKDDRKAVADYSDALRLDPKIEMVRYRRGQALHNLKEYARANADFEQAQKQDPNYPNLLNAWAWQLATCPDAKYRDGELAMRLARKTKHAETLAAAYAETGAFDDAVKTQQRAIEQLKRQKEPRNKAAADQREVKKKEMGKRLAIYQSGQPYRQR